VNHGIKLLLLALLVKPELGLGQQTLSSRFDSFVASAQSAQAAGDYAAAAIDYKQAVKLCPGIPELWANLALMQQETRDFSGAIASFQTANRLNPSLYVPNLFLGIDYAHSGKATEAIPFLVKAETMNHSDPQAPLALGRAYIELRNYPAAIRELSRVTKMSPALGPAWFDLGIARLDKVELDARTMSIEGRQSPYAGALYAESLVKQARFGEAASLYKTLLDSRPQPPCVRSEWGFALLRNHDLVGAASAFAAERTAHPECGLALFGQARLTMENGDTSQAAQLLIDLWDRDRGFFESNAAILFSGSSAKVAAAVPSLSASANQREVPADLRKALLSASNPSAAGAADSFSTTDPDDTASAPAIHGTAEAFYAAGQFRNCERRLGANLAALNADQLRLLAACSYFTGDNQRAYDTATALAALQPHSLDALFWTIRANERLALAALARFQQLAPNSAASHVLLGDIDNQLERYDDAQDQYRKALAIDPADPAAMLGLASACLNSSNNPEAMRLASAALARTPDDPELNLIMAEALIGQHQYAPAEPYLIKSLHAKPQMLPRIHALLGKVYAETGRTQEAIKELKLGESSDEDGSGEYLLAHLYRELGDNTEAYRAIKQMEIIKQQRAARGVKRVEDPDLAPLDQDRAPPATP